MFVQWLWTWSQANVPVKLIGLHILLDLDYLIAARTAPQHSWHNPVGRVMSTLNLGLQCIGLERHAGDQRFDSEVKDCNTMKDFQKAAKTAWRSSWFSCSCQSFTDWSISTFETRKAFRCPQQQPRNSWWAFGSLFSALTPPVVSWTVLEGSQISNKHQKSRRSCPTV